MDAFQFRKLAAAPAATDTVAVYAAGTAREVGNLVASLTDLAGAALANPFTVTAAGGVDGWGFRPAAVVRVDVWWVEGGVYLAQDMTVGARTVPYEPTQTAASQVEAEAGTEAAIRSWSPLRVWQAVAAWFASVGGVTAAATLTATRLIRGSGSRGIEESGIVVDDHDRVSGAGIVVEDVAASRSFTVADLGKDLRVTGANLTLTMPAQAGDGSVFEIGDIINGLHDGTGTLTIAVTSDTLVSDGDKTKVKLKTEWTLKKIASARWHLIGSLE